MIHIEDEPYLKICSTWTGLAKLLCPDEDISSVSQCEGLVDIKKLRNEQHVKLVRDTFESQADYQAAESLFGGEQGDADEPEHTETSSGSSREL